MIIPYKFQLDDIAKFSDLKGRVLLAWEMGLGKTFAALLYAKNNPNLRPTIVVCPAGLKWNWEKEAKVLCRMRSKVISGTKAVKTPDLSPTKLLIINYDILHAWIPYLNSISPQLVILDEAQYCQGRSTRRTKAVKELCRNVPQVIALSGTPLTNRPSDLWPILNILRPDLYPSFFPYAFKYCKPKKTYWGWDFRGSSNLDKLHSQLVDTLMIRRLKSEVLSDLPTKQRTIIPLELKNRKDYDEAKQDFIKWLSVQDKVKARSARRAETICKMGELKRLVGREKLPLVIKWIEDFLDGTDDKLVVFAIHREIIKSLSNHFAGINTVVDGSVIGNKRQLAVETFQKNAKCRLFIGNIKAAGVGLNLTAASTVIFTEMGWTPGEHVQAEDRCHRIGARENIQCFYLIAKDTIEEDLCRITQRKQKILSKTLDGQGREEDLDVYDRLEEALRKA